MSLQAGRNSATTVDAEELSRFSAHAESWWDPSGEFATLHRFNPVRLDYIRRHVAAHFDRDATDGQTLRGLRVLDIGCGGGLLSEPMARLGGEVVGVDPAERNIAIARLHASQSGLDIDYRATDAEALADAGERFDVVLNMEVVEHVADVSAYIDACARMVRPGGLMFMATINRTPKAFALAIVGAEYVLGWLPRGTHSYDKLVRPEELQGALQGSGMRVQAITGVGYSVLSGEWRLTSDLDVNYMLVAEKVDA